jgi:hypothetical protein
MTSSAAAATRLVLVPTTPPRAQGRGDAQVRRFRLARLHLEGRDVSHLERLEHAKRLDD